MVQSSGMWLRLGMQELLAALNPSVLDLSGSLLHSKQRFEGTNEYFQITDFQAPQQGIREEGQRQRQIKWLFQAYL